MGEEGEGHRGKGRAKGQQRKSEQSETKQAERNEAAEHSNQPEGGDIRDTLSACSWADDATSRFPCWPRVGFVTPYQHFWLADSEIGVMEG